MTTPTSTEICEVPGCDRAVTTLREQQSGDVLRVCGEPHVYGDEPFVLDLAENPHPDLLEYAIQLRRAARASDDPILKAFFLGGVEWACRATGWKSETLNAWLDAHEADYPLPEPVVVPVELRPRDEVDWPVMVRRR